jgi:hypothetical protein
MRALKSRTVVLAVIYCHCIVGATSHGDGGAKAVTEATEFLLLRAFRSYAEAAVFVILHS